MHTAPLFHPAALGSDEEAAAVLTKRKEAEAAAEAAAKAAEPPPDPKAKKERGRAEKRSGGGRSGGNRPRSREGGGAGERLEPLFPSSVISREYFTGHSAPILLVGFIDNGSVMITVDELGVLLEWPYDLPWAPVISLLSSPGAPLISSDLP